MAVRAPCTYTRLFNAIGICTCKSKVIRVPILLGSAEAGVCVCHHSSLGHGGTNLQGATTRGHLLTNGTSTW
jgi:hypothetical protein